MSVATQDRVVRLLEQYQSRLHGSNDSYEELDYIKQILASPVFQQYVAGGGAVLHHKDAQEIAKASVDILSGIECSGPEGRPVSPTEQRRRQIYRKQSLKALRNAVTPIMQNKVQHQTEPKSGAGEVLTMEGWDKQQQQQPFSESQHQSSIDEGNGKAGIASKRHRKLSYGSKLDSQSSYGSKLESQCSPHAPVSTVTVNGAHHVPSGDFLDDCIPSSPSYVTPSNVSTYDGQGEPMSLVAAKNKHLSSSSSMLVERPSPPKEYPGMATPISSISSSSSAATRTRRNKKDESFGGDVGQPSKSGSQPNISQLRITQQGDLEFDGPLHEGGVGGGINSTTALTLMNGPTVVRGGRERRDSVEWNSHMGAAMRATVPVLNQAIPSAAVGATPGGKKLILTPVSPLMSRPPPPYNFTHVTQGHTPSDKNMPTPTYIRGQSTGTKNRRTKSDERSLDFNGDIAHPGLVPLIKPMTDGSTTKDFPTAERRKTSLVVSLRKGKDGLGFRVKGLTKDQRGGLCVQDIQAGGLADREGHLKINDQIICINGHSLDGLPHSEAINTLQSALGTVELMVLRDLHSSSSNPHSPQTPGPPSDDQPPPLLLPPRTLPTTSSSTSSTITTPVTASSNSSEPSPKKFQLPSQNMPTFVLQRPHPTTMGHHLEDNLAHVGSEAERIRSDFATLPLTTSGYRQKIVTIELPNTGRGFGFSVISSNNGAVVQSIVEGSIADKDGRLKMDDLLLQVNEESVLHMDSEDVIDSLKSVSKAGLPVKLVVARAVDEAELGMEPGVPLEINDFSDEELERFEVDLHKSDGKGIGITIAGLADADTGKWLNGIYISQLTPHGPAARDGRVKKGDRVLQVNNISLRGIENMVAASILRNSGDSIRLLLSRHQRKLHTLSRDLSSSRSVATDSHDSHMINTSTTSGSRENGICALPPQSLSNNLSPKLHPKSSPTVSTTSGHTSQSHEKETEISMDSSAEQLLMRKWEGVMGSEYEVKVDVVQRALHGQHQNHQSQKSLGIRMETTADLDENQHPDCPHHTIVYIDPEGAVGVRGVLRLGDEILQVNESVLRGLKHSEAISVVQDTPNLVRFIICRSTRSSTSSCPDLGVGVADHVTADANNEATIVDNSLDIADGSPDLTMTLSNDSDEVPTPQEDHLVPLQGVAHPLPVLDYLVDDFSRRFERQSWRERHEEERRRLKEKFEKRREEFERHIREQEEELIQQENELKERQQRQAQEEEEEEGSGCKTQTMWLPFDYTTYLSPNSDLDFTESHLDMASPRSEHHQDLYSSAGTLSPVPGSTSWESDLSEIELVKGEKGLGFSLLDFADPQNEEETVILIHSLVEGGAAAQDSRLRVGDRLVHVNHINVANKPLEYAVHQLTSIPLSSLAVIGINHILPVMSDRSSGDPCSPSRRSLLSEGEEYVDEEEGCGFFEGGTQSTVMGGSEAHHTQDLSETEVKPPSNEEDPVVRPNLDEEEPYYEGEDVAHFKSKKPADSDDDEDEEPPPPYTTYDPQEEKTVEKKDSASRPPLRDQEGGRGERREASPAHNEVVHENDQASGTELQRQHSKLIPEPSLGFQIQTTPKLESDSVSGTGPSDPEQIRIQSEHQQSERVRMLSECRPESDSGSKLATVVSRFSPTLLSHISSLEVGRTLSEMTMITPEDENRTEVLDAEQAIGISTDTSTVTTTTFTTTTACTPLEGSFIKVGVVTSESCVPLENPSFQSEPPSFPISSTSSVLASSTEQQQSCSVTIPSTSSSSSSSSSSVLKLSSFLPKAKGRSKKLEKSSKAANSVGSSKPSKEKGQKKNKDKNSSPASASTHGSHKQQQQQSSQSPKGPVSIPPPASSSALHSLKVRETMSGQPLGNSQESFMDGLSPELSDCGEHSNEMDTSPREAQILRAGYNLGMSVDMDSKINCVVVKSVSSTGAVGRDGRIRVGDRIEAVNGKSLAGQNLARVKGALKRAAKGDEFTITYSPAIVPPPPPHFSLLPPVTSPFVPSPTYDKSSTKTSREAEGNLMNSKMSQQKNEAYYPLPSMVASLHDQEAVSRQTQGASNIQMHSLPPQGGAGAGVVPPHVMQQVQSGNLPPSWNTEGKNVAAYHHIQQQQQQSYYNQMAIEDQMGKPPPPYLYPHQAPPPPAPTTKGRIIGGQSPYSHIVGGNQVPTPPPGIPWQQQLPHPQGLMMMPHSGGSVNWNMSATPQTSGPPAAMVMRDPPQYSELHAMQPPVATPVPSQTHTQFQRHPPPPPPPSSHLTQGTQQPSHLPQQQSQKTVSSVKQQQKTSILHSKVHNNTELHSGTGVEHREHHNQNGSHGGQKAIPPGAYGRSRPGSELTHQHSSGKQKRDEKMAGCHDNDRYSGPVVVKNTSQTEPDYSGLGGVVSGDKYYPLHSRPSTLQGESPDHSHHNSWARAIEELEEEDPSLRSEFPEVDGYLFSVTLNKGKNGLGLNILSETSSKMVRGIVIMGIQTGGVADKCGRLCWGDVILKMNGMSVVGMGQERFQQLLVQAPPTVTFVLLRQPVQQHATSDSTSSDITFDGLSVVKAVSLVKDGKKGLGFSIEKGEKTRGSAAVLVASIVRGGPAEVEGTLQVGDQILNVDGQKILGYAYDKARVLIQQAKARGQVSLVVASRSATSSGGKKPQNRSSGSDTSRDRNHHPVESSGVREKKKSSLKVSRRRRPMSVDTNVNSVPTVASNVNTSVVDGGGAAISYTNVHNEGHPHRYSNRNSLAFPDKELEHSSPHSEPSNDIIPYKECEVTIYRGSKVVGLILVGGSDSHLNGVYVKKIIPDSPAHKDGHLQPGDRILKINHVSMERATHNVALQALQQAPAAVHLTVYRDSPGSCPATPHDNSEVPLPISPPSGIPNPVLGEAVNVPNVHGGGVAGVVGAIVYEVETIELVKPETGGLGLLICEKNEAPGVFIKEVVPNKQAYVDQRLRPGDRILAINGHDMSQVTQDYMVQMLKNCSGTITIVVEHVPVTVPAHVIPPQQQQQPPPAQQEFMTGEMEMEHSFLPPLRPPDYSYRARIPSEREPPPYSNAGSQLPFETPGGAGLNPNGGNYNTGISAVGGQAGGGANLNPSGGNYNTGISAVGGQAGGGANLNPSGGNYNTGISAVGGQAGGGANLNPSGGNYNTGISAVGGQAGGGANLNPSGSNYNTGISAVGGQAGGGANLNLKLNGGNYNTGISAVGGQAGGGANLNPSGGNYSTGISAVGGQAGGAATYGGGGAYVGAQGGVTYGGLGGAYVVPHGGGGAGAYGTGSASFVGHGYGALPPNTHSSYNDIDMPSSGQVEDQVLVIQLHRGTEKLGFSIVGGKGSSHGDLPIYINNIYIDGAAGKDGNLCKGDEILSVNGIGFADVTHECAANTLKYLSGDVEFTIRRRHLFEE